jgi:hypothetical protein
MRRTIRSAAQVQARRRCSRLGHRALLLHRSCGDSDVGHGCFGHGQRASLLETCQHRTQVGLGVVERREPRLFELEAQVAGTWGYRLALLLRLPLGTVHVSLDPTRLLGIRRADPWRVVR